MQDGGPDQQQAECGNGQLTPECGAVHIRQENSQDHQQAECGNSQMKQVCGAAQPMQESGQQQQHAECGNDEGGPTQPMQRSGQNHQQSECGSAQMKPGCGASQHMQEIDQDHQQAGCGNSDQDIAEQLTECGTALCKAQYGDSKINNNADKKIIINKVKYLTINNKLDDDNVYKMPGKITSEGLYQNHEENINHNDCRIKAPPQLVACLQQRSRAMCTETARTPTGTSMGTRGAVHDEGEGGGFGDRLGGVVRNDEVKIGRAHV